MSEDSLIARQIEIVRFRDFDCGKYLGCLQGSPRDGDCLDFAMKRIFDGNPSKKLFPAVDLASGLGVWTSQLVL